VVKVVLIQINFKRFVMFESYDRYLCSGFSADFWSDEGISEAVVFVRGFSDTDWDALLKSISIKSSEWLVRCAETLGDVAEEKSFCALLFLIQIEDEQVRLAAIDSINSLASMGFDISGHSDLIKFALDRIGPECGIVAAQVIRSLEGKLLSR